METPGSKPNPPPNTNSQQLLDVDEQFQLFANCIEDYAFILFDPGHCVTSWNKGAERLTGYTEAEVLGRSGALLFTPEDREKGEDEREILTALREGRAEDERWHVKKDGTRFWGSGIMMRLSKDGQVVGCAKVMRDLTARVKAEQALRDSEERFRLFVENVHDYALFHLNPDGHISGWNPGAERLFGYSEEHILGQPVRILFSPEDAQQHQPEKELAQTLAEGRVEDQRWMVRKDGSRFFARWVTSPMYDDTGRLRGFAKVLQDETVRKRMDEEREHLQQRERELIAERVKSTGEALDRTKQELRALAARLMTVQEEERRRIARELHDDVAQRLALLGMEVDEARQGLPEDMAPILTRIQTKLDTLSEDIRTLSHRLHPSILEDLGLEAALRNLASDYQQKGTAVRFASRGEFSTSVPLPIATALYRIAQEALRNALKHAGDAHITVSLSSSKSELRLTVQDDGAGFDSKRVPSTGGLGVVSMKERARSVGGQLRMRSAPGSGTTVDVAVPLATADEL